MKNSMLFVKLFSASYYYPNKFVIYGEHLKQTCRLHNLIESFRRYAPTRKYLNELQPFGPALLYHERTICTESLSKFQRNIHYSVWFNFPDTFKVI